MDDNDALTDAIAITLYSEIRSAGWSLAELSTELGVSEQTLQRYLTRRERSLPVRVLTTAAKAIGVPLADIIAGAERRVARGSTSEPEEKPRARRPRG
jgi:lambda repressor-like predicted transcriptional regulator